MSNQQWNLSNAPRLDGRTVVVTGASSGLGLASTKHLARLGAHVVMACRNPAKAALARGSVHASCPTASLEVQQLDLSRLTSVRQFSERLLASGQRIDVLMNNAGVMATDRLTTEDGFDLQFGTNHLGHFALTGLLLPRLLENPDGARVVTVSSMGHRAGRMHLDDPNFERRQYQRWGAYFESKLANLLFSAELSRRLQAAGSGVLAVAAHPGSAATELGKVGTSATNAVMRRAFGAVLRGPDAGAEAQVRAATDPMLAPGAFVGPRWGIAGAPRLETPSRQARSIDDAVELWELSERLTGVTYPT